MEGYVYDLPGEQKITFSYTTKGKILRQGCTWRDVFYVMYDKFQRELQEKIDSGEKIEDRLMSINIDLEAVKKNIDKQKQIFSPPPAEFDLVGLKNGIGLA